MSAIAWFRQLAEKGGRQSRNLRPASGKPDEMTAGEADIFGGRSSAL